MLVKLFFALRAAAIPVSVTELLTLLEALHARAADQSARDFYFLARASLVKDERYYDRFDRVFAEVFEGAERVFAVPDAFLRRCFFHYIRFPDETTMRAIVEVHFPGLKQELLAQALRVFYEVRETAGLKKKPSTSELLDWIKLLLVEDIDPALLRAGDGRKLLPALHGALLKNEQDVHLFEQLVFLHRRSR